MNDIMEDTPIKAIPNIANWSENFALAVFDPVRNISVFLHIGRWRQDLGLWRENVIISLPDGTTVFRRSVGDARATEAGPGGSNLAMTVVTPFQEQSWRFLGAARRVPQTVARETLPADGPLERLEFDLTFRAKSPVWDIAPMREETLPVVKGHTEQLGQVAGALRVGNDRFEFSGIGNRDHTRGPRIMSDVFRRHMWLHGSFENGLGFLAYEMETSEDGPPSMSQAVVVDDHRLYPATFEPDFRMPPNGLDELARPFAFRLEYEKARLDIRVADFPATNFIQFTAPWDLYVGRRQIDTQLNRCVAEQAARMLLNDETGGAGHIERSIPGPIIFDSD